MPPRAILRTQVTTQNSSVHAAAQLQCTATMWQSAGFRLLGLKIHSQFCNFLDSQNIYWAKIILSVMTMMTATNSGCCTWAQYKVKTAKWHTPIRGPMLCVARGAMGDVSSVPRCEYRVVLKQTQKQLSALSTDDCNTNQCIPRSSFSVTYLTDNDNQNNVANY